MASVTRPRPQSKTKRGTALARHGRPGAHARRLRLRRSVSGWAAILGSLLLAMLIAEAGAPLPALTALAAGGWLALRFRRGAQRAAAGARAETEVAARLASARIAGMLWGHRLDGRRGDIDLIALGPCLAAVEVKHGRGRVRVDTDGRVRVGRRWLPGTPGNQALFNAAALERALDIDEPVDAVLCIVGMRGRARHLALHHGDLHVTSVRHLPRTLRRLPARLRRADGRRIVRELRHSPRPSRPPR